jgi:hypothetical protein
VGEPLKRSVYAHRASSSEVRRSKMNRKQWLVLLVGTIVLVLSELFPPWLYEDENTSAVRPAGYHFISKPPKVGSSAEMKNLFALRESDTTQFIWVHKDGIRLMGQRIILLSLMPGLWVVFFERRTIINFVSGGLCLCIALVFSGLYIFYVALF